MSIAVMTQVWPTNLPAIRKLILLKLADHADDQGKRVFPSVQTIATACGVSRRTVQVALRGFEDSGVLILVERGGTTRGRANEYDINLIRVQELHGRRSFTGADDDSYGRSSCTPTVKNHPEKEKSRAARVAADQEAKEWAALNRPDLILEEQAERWDRHLRGTGERHSNRDQERQRFIGWLERVKQPKGKRPAKPARALGKFELLTMPDISDGDRSTWAAVTKAVEKEIGVDAWDTWLGKCRFGAISTHAAHVDAPSPFIRDWCAKHYAIPLAGHLSEALGGQFTVTLTAKLEQKEAAE